MDEFDERLDPIIKKLFEHDDRFDKVEQQIADLRNEMHTGFDEMLVILRRLDRERTFTYEWIKRIEAKVDQKLG